MQPYEPRVAGDLSHVSDEALILHEFSHRTANHIAAAAAALHLVKASAAGAGSQLVEDAIERLNAFGAVHRLLARPVRDQVDVARDLVAICRSAMTAAADAGAHRFTVIAPQTWVPGNLARRVNLIAAELIANAVRHALDGRAGCLDVSLAVDGEDLVLRVRDDGPGMRSDAATAGTGLGGGIVSQLVNRSGGTIAIDTGPGGTVVQVTLPLGYPRGDGDWVEF